MEVELQGQSCVLFSMGWRSSACPPWRLSQWMLHSSGERAGPHSPAHRGPSIPTSGPSIMLQVKIGAGRIFFICISLIKSMVEPIFI